MPWCWNHEFVLIWVYGGSKGEGWLEKSGGGTVVHKPVQNGEVSLEKTYAEQSDSPQDEKCNGKSKAVVKRITPLTVEEKATEPPQSDGKIS